MYIVKQFNNITNTVNSCIVYWCRVDEYFKILITLHYKILKINQYQDNFTEIVTRDFNDRRV